MAPEAKPFEQLFEKPIAHRGLHDKDKGIFENTLGAFKAAMKGGYAIECDLQFSADGIPVVFHDFDLKRLCGIGGDVRNKMASELTQLSVGGTTDKIPTLKTMLDLVDEQVPIILELKGRKDNDDGFAGAVLDDIENYKGPIAVMSFAQHLLKDFHDLGCEFPMGLTAEGNEPEVFFKHEEALAYGISFISYDIGDIPNPFIEAQRKQGKKIITWTVRNREQQKLSDQHADQITFEGFDPA
jgi:glycerophosphoryl diester phosphodiesterase